VQQERAECPDQQQVHGIQACDPEHRVRKHVASRNRHQQDEQHHPDAKVEQDEGAADQRDTQVQGVQLCDCNHGSPEDAEQRNGREDGKLDRNTAP